MATKSGGTDETVISGEARWRNAWVWAGYCCWWKIPSYSWIQLSTLQEFSLSLGSHHIPDPTMHRCW